MLDITNSDSHVNTILGTPIPQATRYRRLEMGGDRTWIHALKSLFYAGFRGCIPSGVVFQAVFIDCMQSLFSSKTFRGTLREFIEEYFMRKIREGFATAKNVILAFDEPMFVSPFKCMEQRKRTQGARGSLSHDGRLSLYENVPEDHIALLKNRTYKINFVASVLAVIPGVIRAEGLLRDGRELIVDHYGMRGYTMHGKEEYDEVPTGESDLKIERVVNRYGTTLFISTDSDLIFVGLIDHERSLYADRVEDMHGVVTDPAEIFIRRGCVSVNDTDKDRQYDFVNITVLYQEMSQYMGRMCREMDTVTYRQYVPHVAKIMSIFSGMLGTDFTQSLPGFGGPRLMQHAFDFNSAASRLTFQAFLAAFDVRTSTLDPVKFSNGFVARIYTTLVALRPVATDTLEIVLVRMGNRVRALPNGVHTKITLSGCIAFAHTLNYLLRYWMCVTRVEEFVPDSEGCTEVRYVGRKFRMVFEVLPEHGHGYRRQHNPTLGEFVHTSLTS